MKKFNWLSRVLFCLAASLGASGISHAQTPTAAFGIQAFVTGWNADQIFVVPVSQGTGYVNKAGCTGTTSYPGLFYYGMAAPNRVTIATTTGTMTAGAATNGTTTTTTNSTTTSSTAPDNGYKTHLSTLQLAFALNKPVSLVLSDTANDCVSGWPRIISVKLDK